MDQPPAAVAAWHRVVDARDVALLQELLADDVVFRSPAMHRPQQGRAITTAYLTAAMAVLGPTLSYVREWYRPDSAVLEFTARLGDLEVQGIDMLSWNDRDQLTGFTVMVRPLSALQRLVELMREQMAPPTS